MTKKKRRRWRRGGDGHQGGKTHYEKVAIDHRKRQSGGRWVKLELLEVHEDSGLVPAMREAEYVELLADITAHGIKVPLDVSGQVVLDGRHRLQVAKALRMKRVPVRSVHLNGEDARDWMLKAAVLRRHLSDDQRAMIAALYAKSHPMKRGPKPDEAPAVPGIHSARSRVNFVPTSRPASWASAAGMMNVSPNRVEKAVRVREANPKLAQQVHRGEVKLAEAFRQITHEESRERIADLEPTEGVFDVLVVDPPWQYDRQPSDSGMRGEVDYLTEPLAQLKARTLPAADDAVLWLWTTNSFMREAHELALAWGFTPKTILTWDKVHMGLGSWLRNVTEHCLFCVKGHPATMLTNQTTIIREPRREHSRKPEAFYALVESLCLGRKWELFARAPREGWVVEGIEAGKFAPQAEAQGAEV